MLGKPWEGRFSEKTHHSVEHFTSSIAVDRRLYAHDIAGSIAHCRMLAQTGIITPEEASTLIQGLGQIQREIERNEFEYDDSLEDIHMHIEARLVQKVGKVALKLHTARSRNDQVALDTRMYLRDEVRAVIRQLITLQAVLVELAGHHASTAMPGYTHLQRAQPVLLAHHLMAYVEMFSRDTQRFCECFTRINVMPLGAAALAGTTYPIDQQYTAELLGFPVVAANSMDAVADRDFVIEFLAHASLCMVHLSRFSEELILWSSSEFKFVELPDAFATGSSIMPQKKNPDIPELVRGKAGRVFGDLTALLCTMKSLPLAYNRDMQEDKAPVFDTVDTLRACLDIYCRMLPLLKVDTATMGAAAAQGFLNATDLADYLVTKGMAFRDAHHCVGKAVGYALSRGKELDALTLEELKNFSALIEADIFEILSVPSMVNRRTSHGGTASPNVTAAIETARRRLQKLEHLWTDDSQNG